MKLCALGHCFIPRKPRIEALIPNQCSLGNLLRYACLPGIVRLLAPDSLIAICTTGQRIVNRKTRYQRLQEFSFNDELTSFVYPRGFITKLDRLNAIIEGGNKATA